MGPIDPVMSCARGQTLRQPVHVGGLTQCLHIEHYLSRAAGTLGVDWSHRGALTRNGEVRMRAPPRPRRIWLSADELGTL
jgi:hypothetical protein